ncbi:MAG: hypothetical protein ACJAT2_002338 [Bacteriovoracaceae bacterium]|jgi:hypothetical protein
MKKYLLMLSLLFTTNVFASEAFEEIAITRTNFRSHVDSFLRFNKKDDLFAIVAKKTERRGLNGCRMHRGTISTKKCRVSKKTVNIPNLTLQGSDIVYDNGQLVVTCGFVKDTWLGRKIKLNGKCKFSNIKKNGYTVTQFNVEE